MIVPPPTTSALDVPSLPAGVRRLPIELETRHTVETITVRMPAGFTVDELPPPASLDAPFGRFTMTVTQGDAGVIVIRRELETARALIPPADYAGARAFFERSRAAAAAPIVLVRK
jgi:Domain of Unknown Function with PDB structure (DUF3858)